MNERSVELSNHKQQLEDDKQRVIHLLNSPLLDEDGYPTAEALDIIQLWSYDDPTGWFEFIKQLWNMVEWGWEENEGIHEFFTDKKVYRYRISTGGFSGNESIIRAMMCNNILWSFTWVSSKRGGHYVFEDDVL
jgi:hypothetical protein